MSEYAHGLDEKRVVIRLRSARGDLERVTLWYGDTACRKTPIDWFPEPMELCSRTKYHDWWELTLECPYHRIFYHFELSDGRGDLLLLRRACSRTSWWTTARVFQAPLQPPRGHRPVLGLGARGRGSTTSSRTALPPQGGISASSPPSTNSATSGRAASSAAR